MADFRNMSRNQGHMVRPAGPPPGPPKPPVFPSLCPEFLKGVCSVFQCPKNHPEASLLFCQPYQRDLCQNTTSCQYMHATVDEEQYYKDTGLIPLRFMNQAIVMERGKGPLPNGQPSLFPTDSGTTPTEAKPLNNGVEAPVPVPPPQFTPNMPPFPVMQGNTFPAPPVNALPVIPAQIPIKKELILDLKHKMEVDPANSVKRQKLSYEELEAETNMLKEKVKVLERKIEQLDSTNELLLDKNAKLRDHGRNSSKRSPERKRSPEKRDDRRSRDDRRRGRSKERARSKDTDTGRDSNRGGGNRWESDRPQRDSNFRSAPNNSNETFNSHLRRPGAPDTFRPAHTAHPM